MLTPDEPATELATIREVIRLIVATFRWVFHDPIAQVLGSAFLLIMLWGTHGSVELLGLVIDGWKGPGGALADRARLIPGLPWDQEWIAFGIGVLLLVVIPCLIIHFAFRASLAEYGLGLPKPGTWRFTLTSTALLALFVFPSMYVAAKDPGMRAVYPFYRDFTDLQQFITYELGYFFFFVVIEFTFRGYLLLGLYRVRERLPSVVGVQPGSQVFGQYAILVSMLSYTVWHLGKPLQEQYGTLLWGVVTGAMVLRSGTIWHIVILHWSMNVFLDYLIWTSSHCHL
jgi:hypothetical protein